MIPTTRAALSAQQSSSLDVGAATSDANCRPILDMWIDIRPCEWSRSDLREMSSARRETRFTRMSNLCQVCGWMTTACNALGGESALSVTKMKEFFLRPSYERVLVSTLSTKHAKRTEPYRKDRYELYRATSTGSALRAERNRLGSIIYLVNAQVLMEYTISN